MSKTIYPTAVDLDFFLRSSGLTSATPTAEQQLMFYTEAVAAAVAEWERETGWVPFLTGAAQTRTYDPPGPSPGGAQGPVGLLYGVNAMGGSRKLFLNAGVRTVTTLKVGVTATSTGTALTQNSDFWLRPQNATNYDRPFTYVEFGRAQYGPPASITVLAPFGFGTIIPDDAWFAILKKSAKHLIPSLQTAQFGGLAKWTDADASETYRENPFQHLIDSWDKQNTPVIARYKRKIFA